MPPLEWFEPEKGSEMLDWLSKVSQSMHLVCIWPDDPELKVVVVLEEFVQDKLGYRFGVVPTRQVADTLAGKEGLRLLWFVVHDSHLSQIWD